MVIKPRVNKLTHATHVALSVGQVEERDLPSRLAWASFACLRWRALPGGDLTLIVRARTACP